MKKNSRSRNRRPQQSKENRAMMQGFQELRQGSRTSPIPSGKQYTRKTKHKEF